MKKLIVISCMMMIASIGFGQNNTKLQGPKAKNAKPWMKKSKRPTVVYLKDRTFLKGPAAKNAKPWHKKDSSQTYVKVGITNRHTFKGPKAKNLKAWQLSLINQVDSIVTREAIIKNY